MVLRHPMHGGLLVLLLLLLVSADASAQGAGTDAGALPRTLCGSEAVRHIDLRAAIERTANARPDLHQFALEEQKRIGSGLQSDLEQASFWIYNFSTQLFERVTALRYHVGAHARLWIDVRDTGNANIIGLIPTMIKALEESTGAISRDTSKGIIENVSDVFGQIPAAFGDTLVDFLLFDIADDITAGYFFPWDQGTGEFSNRRNLLYIDSEEGLGNTNSLLNTIAHEFQHLVHYGRNQEADLFINEGCSEVAGLMCGYRDRWNPLFLRNTNSRLLDFPDDLAAREKAYEAAYTLLWYLYEQMGETFLGAIPDINGAGMHVLEQAMEAARPGNDSNAWRFVGRSFALANYLQTNADARYSYRRSIVSNSQPRAKLVRVVPAGQLPGADSVTLQPYGAAYYSYERPGVFAISFKGRYIYGAAAICYTGTEIEILEFAPDQEYVVGSDDGYERVVLVLSELSNATQKITWTLRKVSVVEGVATETPVASFNVRPLPAQNRTVVDFSVAHPGSVWLDLTNTAGQLIRSAISGELLAAGFYSVPIDLSDLPTGSYVARLRTAEGLAVRLIPVTR